jgi:hypothetical protein
MMGARVLGTGSHVLHAIISNHHETLWEYPLLLRFFPIRHHSRAHFLFSSLPTFYFPAAPDAFRLLIETALLGMKYAITTATKDRDLSEMSNLATGITVRDGFTA